MIKHFKYSAAFILTIIIMTCMFSGCTFRKENLKDNKISEVAGSDENDKQTVNDIADTSSPNGSVIQKPSDDDLSPKPDYMNKVVYYAEYSDLYHYDKECTNIKKGSKVLSGKLSEVIKLGHKIACKICIPQY
jgi:hypothetical protein